MRQSCPLMSLIVLSNFPSYDCAPQVIRNVIRHMQSYFSAHVTTNQEDYTHDT
jgi:hypothetical protein